MDSGSPTTTLELLQRARGGDRDALDGLFSRLLPSLRRWAHGRLRRGARDGADTADLVQQAMVGALRHLDHFEPKRRDVLRAYLRKAIRNRVVDEVRRSDRRPRQVTLDHPIKELGLHPISIVLHPEVSATITVNVARSNEEAELQATGRTIQELQAEAEAAHEFDIQELFDDIGGAADETGPLPTRG